MKDYYKVLGVPPNATLEQIKAAYRTLMREYHPDYNRGSVIADGMTKMVNDAYEVLSDQKKRKIYDHNISNVDFEYGAREIENETDPNKMPVSKAVWWWFLDQSKSRIISVVLAVFVVAYHYSAGIPAWTLGKLSISLFINLLLIWYGNAIGPFTGYFYRFHYIDSPTPGFLIKGFGWLVLIVATVNVFCCIYLSMKR